jgi:hypothetical protein
MMTQNGLGSITSSVPYGTAVTYMLCSNFIHLCIFVDVYVKIIYFSHALLVNGLTWSNPWWRR